jgi:hypothetical protein
VTGNAVRKAWLWFGASVLGTSMLGVFNNAISGEAIFGLLVGAAISFVVGMVRLRERWGQGSEVGVYWLGLSVFGAIVLGFALIL